LQEIIIAVPQSISGKPQICIRNQKK